MDSSIKHATQSELEQALGHIQASPKQEGRIEHIIRRPATNEREALEVAELDVTQGMVGDYWFAGIEQAKKHRVYLNSQITLMNSRVIHAIAQDKNRWALAGDQFYVDLDLSDEHLPPGTRLAVGSAILEVTAEPHLGCSKFKDRYGKAAVMLVNSTFGKSLNLRGVNARVVQSGRVSVGGVIKRMTD